jgi:hypothetical protein
MRLRLSAAIDYRLEGLIVGWARRQWPVLRFVPASWIRPALTPTAVRLRRSLIRGALTLAIPAGCVLALLALTP